MEVFMSNIIIREARPQDAEDINRLYTLLLNEDYGKHSIHQGMQEVSTDAKNHVLVAETKGRIIGTIQITICPSLAFDSRPHGLIEYLIVDPEVRRQGIATKLIRKAEDICIAADVSCIQIVSGMNNKEAHIFYANAGYQVPVKGFRKDFV